MEMKHGRTLAYHPQCNSQAKVANKTIAKYLRNVVDTTTLDWEAYWAPFIFSYNTLFHRTIQTSPHFLTFGQMARQPAFNQGDWQKKYLGETSAAEKFCSKLDKLLGKIHLNSKNSTEKLMTVRGSLITYTKKWVWLKIKKI